MARTCPECGSGLVRNKYPHPRGVDVQYDCPTMTCTYSEKKQSNSR